MNIFLIIVLIFILHFKVDERHKQPGMNVAPTSTKTNMYLGYLCPFEEFHVYGYVTNTHIKVFFFSQCESFLWESFLFKISSTPFLLFFISKLNNNNIHFDLKNLDCDSSGRTSWYRNSPTRASDFL